MRISRTLAVLTTVILTSATAQAAEITGDELKKALQENPNILIEAIKANRKAVFDIINQTGLEEQARAQREAEETGRQAYEDAFKNPFKPAIDNKTRIRGNKDAKYTLVEYSDFQCPYCASAYPTVEELRKRHGNDLRFIYKHLPLPFHTQAMPAAQWLEAVAIQSPEKAWKFHDILFKNQDKLGIDFFKKTAKDLGVDVERCEKDAESQAVKDRIAADIEEAKQFGFNGTPGFLLNGIPVKGAYPIEYFEDVIKKLAATKAN
ncbi:thioredoxin domain-containing protein [Candidatus Methylomirabilis sp.]|uniref:DsbA family protein n=1 Tax=Candidatus Methylomirabilis sp. TaxID=2032687 RepID=UPI0030767E30